MIANKKGYKNIFKATSLFGGVQVIQILANLLKGKLVAILIGATGMGIMSLFTVPINMIINISGFGIGTSAVRDISSASANGNNEELGKIIFIFRKLVLISCVLGAMVTCIGAYWLSQYSFGNSDYYLSYILLSVMVIATLQYQANVSILQGMRELKPIAKLTLIGSVITLITAAICYYFWGLKGILASLIIPNCINWVISKFFISKLNLPVISVSWKEVFSAGNTMITFGFALVISSLLGQFCTYILNVYISKVGVIEDVGFMNAAISMTTLSITMVFASMASDYFPRLSAVVEDIKQMNYVVNSQSEILILIVTPILIVFSILAPQMISLFLSKEFIILKDFIRIVSFGMFFKAASYSIGYISFAKMDKKMFFFFEAIFVNVLNLAINLCFYYSWGLKGLAFSFLLNYLTYYLLVSILFNIKYYYKITSSNLKIFSICMMLSISVFLFSLYQTGTVYFIFSGVIFLISILYTFIELNKRIDLWLTVKTLIKKKL